MKQIRGQHLLHLIPFLQASQLQILQKKQCHTNQHNKLIVKKNSVYSLKESTM